MGRVDESHANPCLVNVQFKAGDIREMFLLFSSNTLTKSNMTIKSHGANFFGDIGNKFSSHIKATCFILNVNK